LFVTLFAQAVNNDLTVIRQLLLGVVYTSWLRVQMRTPLRRPTPSSVGEGMQMHNPTATLLEHALLAQGFMGVSKVAFPRRLQPQNGDSTGANLSNAIKCRCRDNMAAHCGALHKELSEPFQLLVQNTQSSSTVWE